MMRTSFNDKNIEVHKKMYQVGFGNMWSNETMLTYYHRYIKNDKIRSVLELGTGTGANLRPFADMGLEVYAEDADSTPFMEIGVKQFGLKKENFRKTNLRSGGCCPQ